MDFSMESPVVCRVLQSVEGFVWWVAFGMEGNESHERFMREAIREALSSDVERTWPNPRVGAVIVERDEVKSTGRFRRDGGPHAEREALSNLGRKPEPNGTLYVTLEPCSTKGRTGACTEAIVQSGIKNVVIGVLDPTPSHQGAGLRILQEAGINVVLGILASECEAINPGYDGRETSH